LVGERGACLLEIDKTQVSSSKNVRELCRIALSAKRESILVSFRFSPDANLTKIRGDYTLVESDIMQNGASSKADETASDIVEVPVIGVSSQEVELPTSRIKSIYRRKPKYSSTDAPNPTVHEVVSRIRKASTNLKLPLKPDELHNAMNNGSSRHVHFPSIEGDNETSIPRGCISHINDMAVNLNELQSTIEAREYEVYEKYSLKNILARRVNSEGWTESKEKKEAIRSTHSWKEIEQKGFACAKCKIR
jgi:hypothetical protein